MFLYNLFVRLAVMLLKNIFAKIISRFSEYGMNVIAIILEAHIVILNQEFRAMNHVIMGFVIL